MYFRHIAPPLPKYILAHITRLLLPYQPLISSNIVKINIPARISHITSDGVGKEQTVMDSDVLYCYISHGYSGLCLTYSFTEGIEHATWPITVWLLHLLGADVDTPPNWSVHCEISEYEVLDDASALVSWVGFHIYTFDGSDHPPVKGIHISNAIPASRR